MTPTCGSSAEGVGSISGQEINTRGDGLASALPGLSGPGMLTASLIQNKVQVTQQQVAGWNS